MWQFNVLKIGELKIYCYVMPGLESNMYLIMEGKTALVIDPNPSNEAIRLMKDSGIQEITVLLTHEHYDHISGVNKLRENFKIEVIATNIASKYLHDPSKNLAKFWDILLLDLSLQRREDGRKVKDESYSCYADKVFSESKKLMWQNHVVLMQAAPGHSRGGALIFIDKILFSGDNLVNGAGVIYRMPGGDWNIYCEKTRPIIKNLPDDTWILPGHGRPARLLELRKYLNKFGDV